VSIAAGLAPSALWIERGVEHSPLAQRLLKRLPGVTANVVDDPTAALGRVDFVSGKRHLVVQQHRGTFLHHCPAGTAGLVCCNYLVANFGSNCPFDCSYCFLQEYLANNPALKLFANVEDGLAEIDAVLRAHPQRTFRIGTGELADSLALDHLTDLSTMLVPFFATRSNAVLELKTKSVAIDNLLRLDPKERVVVSWSVNAAAITESDEPGTASLSARIAAASRVQAAGYRVGLHFDPLIACDGWEEAYRDVVARIFACIDPRRVAWVSLGGLRMTSRLKGIIRRRPANGQALGPALLTGELVPGRDGKERIWRGLRVQMYRRLLADLRAVDGHLPLYICMEPAGVWEKTFGSVPSDREVAERLVAAL
jgi:spore photoproduct lyase